MNVRLGVSVRNALVLVTAAAAAFPVAVAVTV